MFQKKMNKKIEIVVIAMLILDIIDGDFNAISVMDIIKIALYVAFFAVMLINERGKE
jgi:hypothetical protein